MGTRKKSVKKTGTNPLATGTNRPSNRSMLPVAVLISKAHATILSDEATRLRLSRSKFVDVLLHARIGEMEEFQPPKNPRKYEFTEKDLTDRTSVVFYMLPEVRKKLEHEYMQMGFSSAGYWLTAVLNDWIQKPRGLLRE